MIPISLKTFSISFFILFLPLASLTQEHPSIHEEEFREHLDEKIIVEPVEVLTGLENLILNFPDRVANKRIGIVTNHTGLDKQGRPDWVVIEEKTTAQVVSIFTPEHGLTGQYLAGESVSDESEKSQINPKIFSLYGKTKKPTAEMLKGIDLLIYDIQDVGVRFYTYITTLGLVMEAAGEHNIPVYILDRPNPITGKKLGGPLLDLNYQSFVGFYPILIQYGLTSGELARMINGEGWLKVTPELEIIPMINWSRELWYDETTIPWVATSPNIPDVMTATVYPGTCFLEATNVSEGRGTALPFIQIGAPWIDKVLLSQKLNLLNMNGVVFRPVTFTPHHPENSGHRKYHNELCKGVRIVITDRNSFNPVVTGIQLLNMIHNLYPESLKINAASLNRLYGTNELTKLLNDELSLQEILDKIVTDRAIFMKLRSSYLIYK